MLISQRQNHLSSWSNRIKQTAQTNRCRVKATINRGHTLRPLKNTYPCDPTRKMQIAQTSRVWVKTTINQGHTLGPLKNTYPFDPTRKMQIAQTNRVWVKTTINPGHTLQPCSTLWTSTLLHRLTNKTVKNTHTRQKNKNKEDKQTQGTNY